MNEVERARIRVFRNDPAARGDAAVEIPAPGPPASPPWAWRVDGPAPPPSLYAPDTPEFLYWQLSSALSRGRTLWSHHFPEAREWISGPVLRVEPIAGVGLNAYYDREGLRFFRGTNPATREAVHTGDSPDVVAHEQGHAVLDAVRPDLWDAPHFEVAAFHEAFGDLASILVALDEPAVVKTMVEETRGELSRSNLVSRLAEELAAAAHAEFGEGVALPEALRDAVNTFVWTDPVTLPASAPPSQLSSEPHSLCRVATAAFWDVLVAVYEALGGARRGEADLAYAAREVGRLLAEASATAPVGADFFSRVAARAVRAAVGDPSLAAELARRFEARGLRTVEGPPRHIEPEPDIRLVEAGAPVEEGVVRAVASWLGPVERERVWTRPPGESRVLRGRRARDLFLHGREYGPADGAAVEISDPFSFHYDAHGVWTASRVYRSGDGDERDAREFVRRLASAGRIADAGRVLPDARSLIPQGKTHVVLEEEDGVRRVRRAWVAQSSLLRARGEGWRRVKP
jgi:hypothetical protein